MTSPRKIRDMQRVAELSGERPDAAPPKEVPTCKKRLLMDGDAEYLRGLSVGGSHLVSAKWLCDFAQRIENTLAVMK